MTETQLATLTELLQKLVAQNSSSQSKSQHELPKRILRSLRDIAITWICTEWNMYAVNNTNIYIR